MTRKAQGIGAALAVSMMLMPLAEAANLSAASGGTFTFNYDDVALGTYVGGAAFNTNGFYLSGYWNSAASDYTTLSDVALALANGNSPLGLSNVVHDITPTAATNPPGQAPGRGVIATSPSFSIDSVSLSGAGALGLSGVQGFFAPLFPPAGAGLIYGDFRLKHNPIVRQAAWDQSSQPGGTPTGWYIENGLSGITAAVYDLSNLTVTVSDANNWSLVGDLLMSPENGEQLLLGSPFTDVGNFCLGVGSYSGCSAPIQPGPVPIPAAVWLLGSAFAAVARFSPRRPV